MDYRHKKQRVYGSALALIVFIAGYNIWSYNSGYCTTMTLLTFSLPAKLLLAGILLSGLYLLKLRWRINQKLKMNSCRCGAELTPIWSYCPDCGEQRQL